MTECYLGIDVGTSGVRAILTAKDARILASATAMLPATHKQDDMLCQQPHDWWQAVLDCVQKITLLQDCSGLQAIAIDGTSGTTLLTDSRNQPISPALMYNDVRSIELLDSICTAAPPVIACSQSSALVKAVFLYQHYASSNEYLIQQQADWILANFTGKPGCSDWNNALKLGFDVEQLKWPDWLTAIDMGNRLLPDVFPPGKKLAVISKQIAKQTGLPETTRLHAGTTDSIAAFLASGASKPGEAVTSLGSTLVIKLCTRKPVTSTAHGIYSHRLDKHRWLVGGASNTGGAVLKKHFTLNELVSLSEKIDPDTSTGLDYYPLPAKGERFPLSDPEKEPEMLPVPDDRALFLQAIFEGIAQIEKHGYDLLEKLGGDTVLSVRSCGGGSANSKWNSIRQKIVERPFLPAIETEAAYGSALLAAGKL